MTFNAFCLFMEILKLAAPHNFAKHLKKIVLNPCARGIQNPSRHKRATSFPRVYVNLSLPFPEICTNRQYPFPEIYFFLFVFVTKLVFSLPRTRFLAPRALAFWLCWLGYLLGHCWVVCLVKLSVDIVMSLQPCCWVRFLISIFTIILGWSCNRARHRVFGHRQFQLANVNWIWPVSGRRQSCST